MKALLAALLLMGTAACGAADGGKAAGDPQGSEAGSGTETSVLVELKEYSITLDRDSVPAGDVTFQLENVGKVGHAFSVLRTDLPIDQLPIGNSWVVDITAPEIEVAGFEPVFDPGNHQSLSLPLKAGRYVLICNLGHYQYGMRTLFTVA